MHTEALQRVAHEREEEVRLMPTKLTPRTEACTVAHTQNGMGPSAIVHTYAMGPSAIVHTYAIGPSAIVHWMHTCGGGASIWKDACIV